MSKTKTRFALADTLTRSAWERVLYEANLGRTDTEIARLYFIDRVPQIEIAAELGFERKTIGARLRQIEQRVERAWAEIGHRMDTERTVTAPVEYGKTI